MIGRMKIDDHYLTMGVVNGINDNLYFERILGVDDVLPESNPVSIIDAEVERRTAFEYLPEE